MTLPVHSKLLCLLWLRLLSLSRNPPPSHFPLPRIMLLIELFTYLSSLPHSQKEMQRNFIGCPTPRTQSGAGDPEGTQQIGVAESTVVAHLLKDFYKLFLITHQQVICTLPMINASEKAMAPHPSTLAQKIPWTEEPGRLQSMGSLESDTTKRLHFHVSLSCIGEGNGNPLQCSCLENPRDRGAWWAALSGVAQSRTRLKRLSSSSMINAQHSSNFSFGVKELQFSASRCPSLPCRLPMPKISLTFTVTSSEELMGFCLFFFLHSYLRLLNRYTFP